MEHILWLLVGLIIGIIVAMIIKRVRSKSAPPNDQTYEKFGSPPPAPEPGMPSNDPSAIELDSLVEVRGSSYTVRGIADFEEDGFTWREVFIDDGATKAWLSIESDPDTKVSFWRPLDAPELSPEEKSFEYDGVHYKRKERGSASYFTRGQTDLAKSGTVSYADYVGDDGNSLISFERYGAGGDWEASKGSVLIASALTVRSKPVL